MECVRNHRIECPGHDSKECCLNEEDSTMSKITVTVSGETGSGKSAIAGEIEIALKAIGVPVTIAERDTMVVADYQHWIDLYKPEVTIIEENIPCPTTR